MVPMTLLASSSDRNSGLSSPQIRGNHSLGLIRSGPMATAVRKPSRLERAMLLSEGGNDSFHQFTYGRGGGPAAVPGARPGDRSAMAPESGQSRGCSYRNG